MSHWHNLLGINEKSTKEEIMKAYRKKALQFHPDVNKSPDAASRFKEINNAFRALTDSNFKTYNPPKPKPSYSSDIFDNPSQEFKDSMAGHYAGGFDQENDDVFIDSMKNQYEKNDEYTPGKIRSWSMPVAKDTEINLWNKKQDPVELFWKEYERLKRNTAYEDPEKFWEKLDEYMKKIMS